MGCIVIGFLIFLAVWLTIGLGATFGTPGLIIGGAISFVTIIVKIGYDCDIIDKIQRKKTLNNFRRAVNSKNKNKIPKRSYFYRDDILKFIEDLSDVEKLAFIAENFIDYNEIRETACEKIKHNWEGCKCKRCKKEEHNFDINLDYNINEYNEEAQEGKYLGRCAHCGAIKVEHTWQTEVTCSICNGSGRMTISHGNDTYIDSEQCYCNGATETETNSRIEIYRPR
ncbi:MAG: hypothetical protein FWD48_01920 [Oscillospiraceae bacterium]|nr:hypothetical protein [Oscillospiraceae bacterium]